MQSTKQYLPSIYQLIIIALFGLFVSQEAMAQIYKLNDEQKALKSHDDNLERWIPYRKGDNWYFIDSQGEKVLDAPDYQIVYPFQNGLAMIANKGCYGFMDEKGEIVIPCQLEEPHEVLYYRNNPNYLRIRKVVYVEAEETFNNKPTQKPIYSWMGFNRADKTLTDYYSFKQIVVYTKGGPHYESEATKTNLPDDAPIRVKKNNKWGVLDENMKEIISCNYEELFILDNKTFIIKKENNYAQIDTNEVVIQNYDADEIKPHSKGYRIKRGNVYDFNNKENDVYGFINREGVISIPVEMEAIYQNPSSISFLKNDQLGWATLEGQMLTPLGYEKTYWNQSKELIFVGDGEKIYRVSQDTNDLNPTLTKYTNIKKAPGDYWLISQENKKGIYKYAEMVSPIYDDIKTHRLERNGSPYFFVKSKDKWGVLDETGDPILLTKFDSLRPILNSKNLGNNNISYINRSRKLWVLVKEMPIVFIKKNNLWGFLKIDETDKEIVLYDQIHPLFHHQLFSVQKDGKWGVVDHKGEIVIPIEQPFNCSIRGQETANGFFIKLGLKDGLKCLYLKKHFTDKAIQNGAQGPVGSHQVNSNKKYRLSITTEIPNNTPCTCNSKIKELDQDSNNRPQGPAGPQGPQGNTGPQGPPVYYRSFRNPLKAAHSLTSADSIQLKNLLDLQKSNVYGASPQEKEKKRLEAKYVPNIFQEIQEVIDRFFLAKIDDKWGFYNYYLDYFVVSPIYENIFVDFRKQKAKLAKKDGKWWILNECGEIETPYEDSTKKKEKKENKKASYFITQDEGKFLLVDFIGQTYENTQSDTIIPCGYNLFLLKKGPQWDYYDKEKMQAFTCPFDDYTFIQNKKLLGRKNQQWKLYDLALNALTLNAYDTIYLTQYYGNYFIGKNNKMGLLDYNGKEIVPPIFKEIKYENDEFKCEEGIIFIGNDNSYAVYESVEKSPFRSMNHGLTLVRKNGRYGFINTTNEYFKNE